MFKKKWLPIWILIPILTLIGYYSYYSDQKVRVNGVYSIAHIDKIRLARNGWRIWISYRYKGIMYHGEGIDDIANFSLYDADKNFFIKFQQNNPGELHILIPDI